MTGTMKKNCVKLLKKLTFFLAIILSTSAQSQIQSATFNDIYDLIEKRNFFKAKELYDLNKNHISEASQNFVEACLDNAFNRLNESQQKATSLVGDSTNIPDSLKFKAYQLIEDNAAKKYQYKKAMSAAATLLDQYLVYLSKAQLGELENNLKIWTALENVPEQTITANQHTVLKMKKDIAGLDNLSISINNDTLDFIFDTGANISTTSRSVAKRLNMKIIPVDIQVGSITGKKIPAQLALCDKMTMGSVTLQNVVFLVLDDEGLSFPQINYQIYGILGFPVIEALKEVQITRDGYFIIPKERTTFSGNPNMAMDGLTPMIYMNEKHFKFDTGADNTILYHAFYIAHKDEIDRKYTPTKVSFGGAGGEAAFNGFVITRTFEISNKKVTLKNIDLLMEKINERETVYGNIGQDLIGQFNKMTLNFSEMFIKFD